MLQCASAVTQRIKEAEDAMAAGTYQAASAICARDHSVRVSRLVEKVAVALDVRGEIERVLPRQAFGKFSVSTLQRLDDLQVIDDGTCGAIVLRDREKIYHIWSARTKISGSIYAFGGVPSDRLGLVPQTDLISLRYGTHTKSLIPSSCCAADEPAAQGTNN